MTHTRSPRRWVSPALCFVLGLLGSARIASSQSVAATTLGPGRSYDATSQYVIGGTTSSFQFIATPFTYTGPSGLLLDEVRLGLNTGSARTYLVSLLRGTDIVTAATVTTWSVPITPAFPGYALITLAATGSIPLVSTETYWLAVAGLGPVGGWSMADVGTRRPIYVRDVFSADWRFDRTATRAPAYEVTVREGGVVGPPAVVPEPSTLLLLTTGLFGVALMRRRTTSSPR